MMHSTLYWRERTCARGFRFALVGVLTTVLMSAGAHATESVAYTYDVLGRLIKADQTNGASVHTESIQYDAAGNRTSHVLQGSPNGSATGVIVVPMGSGFTVIPFDRQR